MNPRYDSIRQVLKIIKQNSVVNLVAYQNYSRNLLK